MALVRWDCWVLLGPGWGRRDDGGSALGMRAWTGWPVALGLIMALGPGRGRRDDGMCSGGWVNVFSFGGNVSSFRANVSSFWADVFSFEGDVSTLARNVSSCRWGALVGDGARTEGEIPRLRCAALGTTTAAGGGSGPGIAGAGNDVYASNAISACVAGGDGGDSDVSEERGGRRGVR